MAVFSKFAVSVVAVAVGYEEEHCETAFALRMEKLGPSGAIPQDSILHDKSKVEVVDLTPNVGLKQHFLGNEEKLQVEHLDAFKITEQSPPILDVSAPSTSSQGGGRANQATETFDKQLFALKDALKQEKRNGLDCTYDREKVFLSALEEVTGCSREDKQAAFKVWNHLLDASPEQMEEFWTSVEDKAKTHLPMFNSECTLSGMRDHLVAVLNKMNQPVTTHEKQQNTKLRNINLVGCAVIGGVVVCVISFFICCYVLSGLKTKKTKK